MLHRYDLAILRGAAVPTLVTGALLMVGSAVVAGARGALGAAFGVAVVSLFFTIGLVAIAWASKISPFVMMQVAIFSYLIKIALLGLLVVTLADTEVFNTRAFALAVLISTLVWVGAQVRAFSTMKMMYVEPLTPDVQPAPSGAEGRPDAGLPT